MSRLPRLLAPLSVAAAFAVAAPAAQAGTTATFPAVGPLTTTVTITDPGPAFDTVHLTVTAADPSKLDDTWVYLGASTPWYAIGLDGVREARYGGDSQVAPPMCSVYGGPSIYDVQVTPSGASFTADLPKGELISYADIEVGVGIDGVHPPCDASGFAGLEIDYVNTNEEIDGFSWAVPAAPVITAAAGGRRQVALSFDQARGTAYDIYRVADGVRTLYLNNLRGNGDDVQVVIIENPDGSELEPGTNYSFEVRATRLFNPDRSQEDQLVSPFSALSTVATLAVQTVTFTAAPAASTTARSAQFSWTMGANDAGDAPYCLLDRTENSATEIPCTVTGVTIDGLSVGAHTLSVYPWDGESAYTHSWTVADAPTPPAPVAPAPTAPPKNLADLDGDGIENTWLIGGKPAPAPGTPKARVTGGNVKLVLAAAPKGAKKVRVYRADGKGGYKLVKTLSPKSKTFTDKKVKPGHTYRYKVVAVNAKGQQGKASKAVTAKPNKKEQ